MRVCGLNPTSSTLPHEFSAGSGRPSISRPCPHPNFNRGGRASPPLTSPSSADVNLMELRTASPHPIVIAHDLSVVKPHERRSLCVPGQDLRGWLDRGGSPTSRLHPYTKVLRARPDPGPDLEVSRRPIPLKAKFPSLPPAERLPFIRGVRSPQPICS